MPDYIQLAVEERSVTGKKVRQLRREGIIPAVLYGPEVEPLNLSINARDLRMVLRDAGGTNLIELVMGDTTIPTLAREVQRDPIRGDILHVDFYRVSMTRVISADVPVVVFGEHELVTTGAAVLVQGMNTITVEALPGNLPSQIEIDMAQLEEIGDQILLGDVTRPEGVRFLTDDTELVVKLDYPVMPEEEEEEVEEEMLFGEEGAEPEVISERRDEDEEDEG